MISANKGDFPKDYRTCDEYVQLCDENEFLWCLALKEGRIWLAFFGLEYFSPNRFVFDIDYDGIGDRQIANTRCFYTQNVSFEQWMDLRTMIDGKDTQGIWENIKSMIADRIKSGAQFNKLELQI